MKIAATLIAVATVFAGSSVVYADQAVESVRNLATPSVTDLPEYFVSKPVTSVTTGITVYHTDGNRIGAVRAVIHKEGVVNTVYIGTEEYSATTITVENGRAIYKA
ncbi:MAG: hypothetical protein ACSHX3_04430 [Litorimonas sp.]